MDVVQPKTEISKSDLTSSLTRELRKGSDNETHGTERGKLKSEKKADVHADKGTSTDKGADSFTDKDAAMHTDKFIQTEEAGVSHTFKGAAMLTDTGVPTDKGADAHTDKGAALHASKEENKATSSGEQRCVSFSLMFCCGRCGCHLSWS